MESAERLGQDGLPHLQLKDRVYQYLRQGIVDGDFEVGAALREVDIATRLGVSKTPIREAFVRLHKDRLVRLIPYKGAVVAGYSREDLREVYEVRELIEGACAATAAAEPTGRLRADLERNVQAGRDALAADDVAEVVRLFEEFDRLIYSQSNNKWINDLIENLEGHQRRIGRLTVGIPGRLEQSIEEHAGICSAIAQGDAEGAEKLMRSHVVSVMADQLENFSDSGPA
ncbi:GntR family transcriptional regulator [Streptosporangium sp. NBC_01755]|uniref:GntR family transcriptional regulator n=1 Tax=unclassified Streptosporangium TaxID=2632669 RepID=UPI002DDAA642|nr:MULTISPECIES: GntR family transcriptional regulator [unclassified Streptosporangium]WSA26601.1 GntR family transcriptional regulator [Streptosporangium sp. NBC_01810]WSD01975.1 GntR family transcriptional regulator [Streptosporangium sp. NBC_01755]